MTVSLKKLEFHKIQEMLKNPAALLGPFAYRNEPATEAEEVLVRQAETRGSQYLRLCLT